MMDHSFDFAGALDFRGKTVLVVGGSSGIGNGIAHAFSQLSAEVHVWGTRAARDDYSADEGSDLTGLHYVCVDLADQAALDTYQPPFHRLDALVQSQGTVLYKRAEFQMEGFDKVTRVNLGSVMACATKFHEMLQASRSSMIMLSSTAAYRTTRSNPAYAASKAGAMQLTATLGEAWAGDGIRVNGIAPGLVDTKLTKATTANPARLEAMLSRVPIGRQGQPRDMAGAALFLASPLASYVIGQTLIVDGGLTLA